MIISGTGKSFSGSPRAIQQRKDFIQWRNKFNTQARAAERKAEEGFAVDVALGAAVGAFDGLVGAPEGAAGGAGINLVTPYIYKALEISERSH